MHGHTGRSIALTLTVALAVGCRTYEPRPLRPEEHRREWNARALEREAFVELLDDLVRPREAGPGPGSRGPASPAPGFDASDGLTLEEGQLVALVFNPRLRLARLEARLVAAGAEHGGLWEDPELSLSVLRITESVPDRWVVTPGLAFSIPLSGRLDAEQRLAGARQHAAREGVLEAEWAVWNEVRTAWGEWWAAGRRAAVTQELARTLEGLTETTRSLQQNGELPRTEAALFEVELGRARSRITRLRGEETAREHHLRALLGIAPTAPVELRASPADMGDLADVGDVGQPPPAAGSHDHPTLARLRHEYDAAERTLQREILRQVPDLTLGPLYESDAGQSRIGFLGGIPLPMFHANRRAIAEAGVAREIARATYEAEVESLAARRAEAAARAAAAGVQAAQLAPVVERASGLFEDELELLRIGEGSSLVLLESLTRSHEGLLELLEARLARLLTVTEVEYLTGPPHAGWPFATEEVTP